MTDGAGDFLIVEDIYPNKAYNDQDETLVKDSVITFYVCKISLFKQRILSSFRDLAIFISQNIINQTLWLTICN